MLNRRSILLSAAGLPWASLAQEDVETTLPLEDVTGDIPVASRLYGSKPAKTKEEIAALLILAKAPKNKGLIETAQYFERLIEVNEEGHFYNAQWPMRWNPVIVGFYQVTSLPKQYVYQKGDTIDWCAAFLNWCLIRSGLTPTRSAMSGSFRLGRGLGRPTEDPVLGDLVVFQRADPELGKLGFGHVGIYMGEKDGKLKILGGNQRRGARYSSVNVSFFPRSNDLLVLHSFRSLATIPKLAQKIS